jgi:sulfite exporter TauE/SafE
MIGAAFGALGAVFTITPQMRGIAAIFSGLYLILFGLQMTRVMSLKWMHWAFPTVLMRGVRGQLSVTPSPFRIGLLTGFLLGCGPLQAMYILAAGLGNPLQAGLYLALFSLGTLGPLLVFGTLASAVPRRVVDALVNASGLLVLLMGLMMLNKGLIFTGMGLDADSLLQRLGRNAEKTGSSLSMPPIIHMH